MKKQQLVYAILCVSCVFVSCSDGKTDAEHVAEIEAKYNLKTTEVKEEVSKIQERTIDLMEYTLTYSSQYLFSWNTVLSEDFKTIDGVVDAKVYQLGMPDKLGMAGIAYQKNKVTSNIPGAIVGLLNGYENTGAVISNHTETDVSEKYGYKAILGKGNITFNDTKTMGEYTFLIIADKKQAIQIQGLFETAGSEEAKKFDALLESIIIKKK